MAGSRPFSRFGLPAGPSRGNARRAGWLSHLKRIRDGNAPRPHTPDWGRVELSIPELDYYILLARFPDLSAPDADIRMRAWKSFLASPLSEPYRVQK